MTESRANILADLWVKVDQQWRDLKEQRDIVGAELMSEMQLGEEIRTASGAGARMMPGVARFDPELATKVVSKEWLPKITHTVTTVSAELAKENLPPALYEQCRKPPGAPYLKRL